MFSCFHRDREHPNAPPLMIYGDSHAAYLFTAIPLQHKDLTQMSITMFRIGRDKKVIHFDPGDLTPQSIMAISYGEIDCRCHVNKQIRKGRHEIEILTSLVDAYLAVLEECAKQVRYIIMVAIVPPIDQEDIESSSYCHRKYMNTLLDAMDGTNEERIRYASTMNSLLETRCRSHEKLIFFHPFSFYQKENGCLKWELSDQTFHIAKKHNGRFQDAFISLYQSLL